MLLYMYVRRTTAGEQKMCKLSEQVPFTVECKSTYVFFEVIAAFNAEVVARRYAEDCQSANPKFEYRVRMVL